MSIQTSTSGSIGLTPLMRASATGQTHVVIELLRDGADVNARGPRGSTALMFAAGGGHLEVVRALVESGAELDAAEDGGWDALRHAEEDGEFEIVHYLSNKLRNIRQTARKREAAILSSMRV